MLVSAARFVMDRREYMVINARDVAESERARLEREAILNSAPIGIAVTRNNCFVQTNPHFDQIHGWPRGALYGQSGLAVWPDPAPRPAPSCSTRGDSSRSGSRRARSQAGNSVPPSAPTAGAEQVTAFDDMLKWEAGGAKPAGDDVVTPATSCS